MKNQNLNSEREIEIWKGKKKMEKMHTSAFNVLSALRIVDTKMVWENEKGKLEKMKVLSLFDGISCGMVALERVGIPVERYVAYEIEEDAIKVSKHN